MLRLRPTVVILEAVFVAVVVGVLLAAAGRFTVSAWVIGLVVAAVLATTRVIRVRQRSLTVTEDGLEVQRDRYALQVPWASFTGVEHRRLQGLIPVEELVASSSVVIPRLSNGKPGSVPKALQAQSDPAPTRIQVSSYDRNWRAGPIGDRLRAHNVPI